MGNSWLVLSWIFSAMISMVCAMLAMRYANQTRDLVSQVQQESGGATYPELEQELVELYQQLRQVSEPELHQAARDYLGIKLSSNTDSEELAQEIVEWYRDANAGKNTLVVEFHRWPGYSQTQ